VRTWRALLALLLRVQGFSKFLLINLFEGTGEAGQGFLYDWKRWELNVELSICTWMKRVELGEVAGVGLKPVGKFGELDT